MKRMIRYTVKPYRAEENAGYVERVFSALARERPAGVLAPEPSRSPTPSRPAA